ncbi:zinc transporter ZIP9-B-like [Dendronephthya gigantea]|uniref:zinc transporter ZIP9-B-like n=1 Tax=Dendronephthya gigantea TaxID=151771 RepID=UPI00106A65FD|nr:zinc transporter ZIP9-B-like [Dendronephthya gigantea]
MEHFTGILSLSFAMLTGCYIAGTLPLSISLSESKLHMVTVLGSGLLVGTALAVIIPEGVNALYEESSHHHEHHHEVTMAPKTTPHATSAGGFLPNLGSMPEVEPHAFIGISLCLGFVFMLLIDHCLGGHSHTPDVENNGRQNRGNFTATVGLVVHAAADGIAMGAAAVSSKPDVEIIVFLAIMLHKAPAAFGLTTFLLQQGMQRNKIRKHLFIFSMAAPVLAILTYTCLSQSGKELFSSVNGTGLAMLFSAGTFLYVATVHVLPETTNLAHNSTGSEGSSGHEHHKKSDLIALIIGIIFPLILTTTHRHHH